jgi:hypothetical protein
MFDQGMKRLKFNYLAGVVALAIVGILDALGIDDLITTLVPVSC